MGEYGALDLTSPLMLAHPQAVGLQALWMAEPDLLQGTQRWLDVVAGTVGTLTGMAWPPTLTSGPSLASEVLGFDGTDDAVNLGTTVGEYALTQPFSVVIDCTPTLINSANHGLLGNGDGTSGWHLRVTSTNVFRFILLGANGSFYGADTSVVTAGTRYILVATFDGVSTALTYLNGRLNSLSINSGSPNTLPTTAAVLLGKLIITASFFAGTVRQVRLYTRALGAAEIPGVVEECLLGNPTLLQWDDADEDEDWWARAVAGVSYPQLERGIRGLTRGLGIGSR